MKYDGLCVSALRALCIDLINKAKSGHPGTALDAAPLVYTLYSRFLTVDPEHPDWIKRDRFVLSSGHASALLYSVLHLAGYAISMADLKQFRQLDSITPGHPEYRLTPGVDCSTGPLGQGIGQAVGMALAEAHLRAIYPDSFDLFAHYTYCLCGDGDLEEGISQEAAALAGLYKLNKLILIYDANKATLDGYSDWTFKEDVMGRFASLGWNVCEVADGNDIEALADALANAQKSDKPTFIKMNTFIGFGSAFQGTSKTHGAPLGLEDGEHAKNVYGWKYPPFEIPDEVYLTFRESTAKRGKDAYDAWVKVKNAYFLKHPQRANFLDSTIDNDVSQFVFREAPVFPEDEKAATRNTSNQILNLVQEELPNLIGGAADVASSVKTDIKGGSDFSFGNPAGTVLRYGVREFGMASVANGITLHGGLRTYAGTFLAFSDYMKGAIRLAALQHIPTIFLFSHDSLAVGEDGPTHQPVDQLPMLRAIPNLRVFRPCDSRETAYAWREALRSTRMPTCIILTRQAVPQIPGSGESGLLRGAYVISKENRKAAATIIASGSEVSLAVEAQKLLLSEGIDVRIVSMPEMNLFLAQSREYRDSVLGNPRSRRLVLEMASPFGLTALADDIMAVNSFGKSAPASDVLADFGFTPAAVANRVRSLVDKGK